MYISDILHRCAESGLNEFFMKELFPSLSSVREYAPSPPKIIDLMLVVKSASNIFVRWIINLLSSV